ncbi:MAG TPA: prolipoprotein diacylglyceryl transferase [Anaerolineaceae bacterium]|nr:prolipoprotein diacylglyceryl transferase [Anaerolineaceae bacterium]
MSIDRYGILIGDTRIIYFYALIIMFGVVVAAFLSARRAAKYGQDPERVWDILTWVIIAGVIGARLWHVLTPSPALVAQGITTQYYFTHPLELINTRQGGLGIAGAVAGGALALFIYTRVKKISFLAWVDIVAPGLILAQAIGRWGNFVNQELYGAPTTLPWGIYIDPAHRLPGFENFSYYHPTFLYESLLNVAVMFLLLYIERRFWGRLKSGNIFLGYLVGYSIVRILMEMLRLDSSQVAGLNANQTLYAVIGTLAVLTLIVRHVFSVREQPPVVEE